MDISYQTAKYAMKYYRKGKEGSSDGGGAACVLYGFPVNKSQAFISVTLSATFFGTSFYLEKICAC